MNYLLKEPVFCEQLARFLKPELFSNDYVITRSMTGQEKLSGLIESKVQIWTPEPKMDAMFTIVNKYSKIYKSEQSETGWRLCNMEKDFKYYQPDLQPTVYTFKIIARQYLKVTTERLRNSLFHYHGNTLLVKNIIVDDLTIDEIKTLVKACSYDIAIWDVVLK